MIKMITKWRNRGRAAGLLSALFLTLAAASGQHLVQSSPAYELEATRLRSAPESKYEFNRALLRDVLRFLADDSGISYIGLSEEDQNQTVFVTFNITASPFSALETVANTHGVALVIDRGVWHMRPLDDKQMIGRTYQLKYNTHEQYEARGASRGGGAGGAGGGGGGGGGGGLPSTGVGSGGAELMFEPNVDEMLDSLKMLLGIPTNGWEANRAPGTDVDSFGEHPMRMPASTVQFQTTDSQGGAQVIYVSDNNAIYVVATRQQHQWVEGFLQTADRQQPLIAVEVKVFETSRNPSKEFGIDWRGTLGDGYTAELTDEDGDWLSTNVNMDRWGDTKAPDNALLNAEQVSLTLRALRSDQETTSVSYPRVVTMNNREVVINSVVNQPVLSSATTTNSGVGGTNTQQIEYLPVGTIINVLPKIMADNEVQMLVALTVSDIIGEEVIAGNTYPIVSSRIYAAPLRVESGYTVAIAGLDQARDAMSETRLPFLGRLPGLKHLFGSTERRRNKKNLMIFITPSILKPKSHGIGETATAEIPITHDDPLQAAPQIYPDGQLEGGIESLGDAVLWADRENRRLDQVLKESRDDKETYRQIRRLKALCDSLLGWIDTTGTDYPSYADRLSVHKWSLARIAQRCIKMQLQYGKNRLATDI